MEEASDAAARAVFDTNVFGILNVLRAVLPTLRAQRSGRIVNLSSIGGFIGSAGSGIFFATKFAVEGFSEALAREVGPLGIDVIIVEPGYFRTDFLDPSPLSTEGTVIDDYAETAAPPGNTLPTSTMPSPATRSEKAAAAIVEIASAERSPLRISSWAEILSQRLPTNLNSSPRSSRPGATCQPPRITTTL